MINQTYIFNLKLNYKRNGLNYARFYIKYYSNFVTLLQMLQLRQFLEIKFILIVLHTFILKQIIIIIKGINKFFLDGGFEPLPSWLEPS